MKKRDRVVCFLLSLVIAIVSVPLFGGAAFAETDAHTVQSFSVTLGRPLYIDYDSMWVTQRYDDGTYSDSYRYYYTKNLAFFTVVYDGGKVFEGIASDVEKMFGESPKFIDTQGYNSQWTVGRHSQDIIFKNITYTLDVEVAAFPYKSFKIDNRDGLTVSFEEHDGTVKSGKVTAFRNWSYTGSSGYLQTELGAFFVKFTYGSYKNGNPAYEKNLKATLGELESNTFTIEPIYLFRVHNVGKRINELDLFENFDGRVNITNLDNVVLASFNLIREYHNYDGFFDAKLLETVYSVPVNDVKEAIEENFILGKLDITQSKYYDRQSGMMHIPQKSDTVASQRASFKYYSESGEFDTVYENFTNDIKTVIHWSSDGKILSIVKTHTHIGEKCDAVQASCEKNGSFEYYKCTVCSRLFSDSLCEHETTLEKVFIRGRHNFSSDGVCKACGKQCSVIPTQNATLFYDDSIIFTEKAAVEDISELVTPANGKSIKSIYSGSAYVGVFGSGSVICAFYDGVLDGVYTIALSGDLNGDGVCDVLDAMLCEKAVNGHTELKTYQKYAANGGSADGIDISSYQRTVNEALK